VGLVATAHNPLTHISFFLIVCAVGGCLVRAPTYYPPFIKLAVSSQPAESFLFILVYSCRIQNKHSLSLFTFLFFIHLFHVYPSFFFWCLVQSGLFLFLKLAFLCYSSTALAGGYSCVTLTLTLILRQTCGASAYDAPTIDGHVK